MTLGELKLDDFHALQIRIYHQRELCYSAALTNDLELGRQRPDEPPPFFFDAPRKRLVIAGLNEKLVSREHLSIKLLPAQDGQEYPRIELRNLSGKRSLQVEGHGKLGPGETTCLATPVLVSLDEIAIRVEPRPEENWQVQSLPHQTVAPRRLSGVLRSGTAFAAGESSASRMVPSAILSVAHKEQPSADQLIHWLQEMMGVLQSAAGAADFLAQAVEAVDRIVGLDAVVAVRFESDRSWTVVAARERVTPASESERHMPSNTILQQVFDQKRTLRHLPADTDSTASLQNVKALVASPILNTDGEPIGGLYGVRFGSRGSHLPQISELEATMVEVLACGAAAGLAREAEQERALAERIRFEQYFTPQLASELESNPQMLDGKDAEISVLFCDIVRFSAISQRIGSLTTLRWISDVMDKLSVVILKHDGVLVDYVGDELMAMWGAPKSQANHAIQACAAACELLQCRADIDAQWLSIVGEPFDFRTGICSGIASVGNVGSTRKFKYGPLGNTVNLASRLQGSAKQFGVRQVISHATAQAVADDHDLLCRPLGTTRLVNLSQPVHVYELCEQVTPSSKRLASGFSRAIQAHQSGDHNATEVELSQLASEFPDDQPTLRLLKRLRSGQQPADCLWHFESK